MTLCIAIAAHNEEAQLEACLESASFADEIVVLLDRCTDRSKAIAAQFTDRILEGAWPKEGVRRNHLLANCRSEWIFELDADEQISTELANELKQIALTEAKEAHPILIDNHIGNRLVKHGWGPTCFGVPCKISLFPKNSKHYDEKTLDAHVPYSLHVSTGHNLKNALTHYREKNISEVLKRLDTYTTLRAREWRRDPKKMGKLRSHVRRCFTYFYKTYVRRKGYKEGSYGLLIALCASMYYILSYIKANSEDALE